MSSLFVHQKIENFKTQNSGWNSKQWTVAACFLRQHLEYSRKVKFTAPVVLGGGGGAACHMRVKEWRMMPTPNITSKNLMGKIGKISLDRNLSSPILFILTSQK